MYNNEKLEKILGQTRISGEQENANVFKEQIEFDKLKTKVLKYIMYKKRTEQEIKRKFEQEDIELLDNVIEQLKEIGYINDNNYIERAVSEHMNLNNLSLKLIDCITNESSFSLIFGKLLIISLKTSSTFI